MTAPPAVATAHDTKPTLIMSIWCTCYAIAIILFRCAGRWHRTERVWVEDVIILLSVLVLTVRMVLVSFILKFGTNNVDLRSVTGEDDVRRREIGSQLVLVCRLLYLTFLWMVKLSAGIYISRLTNQFWASKSLTSNTSGGRAIKAFLSEYLNHLFYTFLGISCIAVVISEAAECRPFSHYWQVTPTASLSCRVAPGNLFTMGIFDILTDLTLVALPLPMILSAKLPTKIKFETLLLMLFPLVNVAFTCYRLPVIHANDGSQRYRTLLASINMLIATSSANTLVVISFLKDRGFKKLKYRRHGEDGDDSPGDHVTSSGVELESIDNTNSLHNTGPFSKRKSPLPSPRERMPTWGSDEDLMRDDSDGGPSIQTTSARDGENERTDGIGQGVVVLVRDSTGHLSPDSQAETSIVAARRVEAEDRSKGVTGALSAPRSRTSLHSGIVVETSWKVDISQK